MNGNKTILRVSLHSCTAEHFPFFFRLPIIIDHQTPNCYRSVESM
jgi:hypothetical protein